MYFKHNQRKLS